MLQARETWPRTAEVDGHRAEGGPEQAELALVEARYVDLRRRAVCADRLGDVRG